jgi:CRP-like cAMP-binding protein
MSSSVLENAVLTHPFVKGMSAAHLQVLTQCAMLTQFEPGQTLFHEGDIANRFYLIQQGKVILETHTRHGAVVTIETVGAGEVVGWSWLFPPYYWHFSACALEATQAIFFYGTRLRECCEEDTELGYQLMRRVATVLMHRLQATVQHSLQLAAERPAPG